MSWCLDFLSGLISNTANLWRNLTVRHGCSVIYDEIWKCHVNIVMDHKVFCSVEFPDLQPVLNWSVSCRFCSQKFNLLVILIGIADHAGPLVQYFLFTKIQSLIGIADHAGPLVMHRTEWRNVRKKPKATLKHKTNLVVRLRFFYGPFLPIWYCINLSFWYLDAVCSAATRVLLVWIPCGIPYVKTTRWHTWHREGWCK
jgi:hypothetical protein